MNEKRIQSMLSMIQWWWCFDHEERNFPIREFSSHDWKIIAHFYSRKIHNCIKGWIYIFIPLNQFVSETRAWNTKNGVARGAVNWERHIWPSEDNKIFSVVISLKKIVLKSVEPFPSHKITWRELFHRKYFVFKSSKFLSLVGSLSFPV